MCIYLIWESKIPNPPLNDHFSCSFPGAITSLNYTHMRAEVDMKFTAPFGFLYDFCQVYIR